MKTFVRFNEKIGNNTLLISVRRGLTYMIPLVLIGSMALFFLSLPIPAYQSMMEEIFGIHWKSIFLYIREGTFNILSIIMIISISYSYFVEFKELHVHNISPIIAASVSLASFIAISGISREGFLLENLGVMGVFVAIFTAVSSSWLFLKLSSIKALRINAFTDGANSAFNYALSSIFPAAITIIAFAAINHALIIFFGISNIQSFISDFFRDVFAKIESPLWCGILFVVLIHVFWFLGMHGSNILEPVAQSIFVPALTVNQVLIESHRLPTEIFTKTFFDTFVLMGGCGSALCLISAILITGRSKNQLQLAKLSLIPVIFNINELIVFGIPIVLNPIFMIPFLLVPIVLTLSSFLAMYYGFVPYTSNLVEWTTPIFLSGYISTKSISGSILQLFNLFLGILCYIPFVKLAENIYEVQMKNSIKNVYDFFKQNEGLGAALALLDRYDDIGSISRFLAVDLEHNLKHNKMTLFYQPQVNYEGNVIGMEALLRWNHDSYGYIYPPLIIALAEESQIIDKLGYWILDTACSDLKRMDEKGLLYQSVSVNVSAAQLENEGFAQNLEEIINKHLIKPQRLKIEITEKLALKSNKKIIQQIHSIKKMGIKLEMDDFGMGHSSLIYLKEYQFDTIKLDGSLIRDIMSNYNCRNIISSIVHLGKDLNYSVIAEYVENKEQRNILHELGCDQYQGYLYSKPVPFSELVEYMSKKQQEFPIEG
jgi:lactose/cellobiose-specific phosphotransferase system IIC component